MNESKLRWGILSTAEIAQKNWRAIYNSGNGIVTAVASRDAQRSGDFITVVRGAASGTIKDTLITSTSGADNNQTRRRQSASHRAIESGSLQGRFRALRISSLRGLPTD